MKDTILVAKTDFDKSIIFHAYSVLTDQITIQLISLSKLDEKQLKFICQYSETKSCLITANTKFQDSVLLNDIQAESSCAAPQNSKTTNSWSNFSEKPAV